MKKLFSAMMAATMVAGMSVSAFAYETSSLTRSGDFTNKPDYAVIGAFIEDGNTYRKITNADKVDGGTKLYFPILISGEELDETETITPANIGNMYYASKASEVSKLKASVKDEIGGKYIDSAAIVKKDVKIGASTGKLATPATFKTTLTATTIAAVTGGATEKLTLTIGGETFTTASIQLENNMTSVDIAQLFNDVSSTNYTAKATAGSAELTFTSAATGAAATGIADGTNAVLAATTTSSDLTAGSTLTTTTDGLKAGEDGVAANSGIGKVYCVEVKMADYYKNEETEVEFNIQLKNSGKTEFNSKDDAKAANWKADFDLGKDSAQFDDTNKAKDVNGAKLKKFKKGDLEIEIGEKTRSLQLDEVIVAGGKTEDVDHIYIENDKTIDNAFTFDVKASGQDDLYLELNQDAIKDLAVSNSKADLTFFNFPGEPEFDFTGTATFAVEDEDEDNYFYEVVDGELVESRAKYNKEDGVFELRTNKLGSYVISDKELKVSEGKEENDAENKEQEGTGGDATADATTGANGEKGNANTGAADLIGVASALAVVSIAAAGAVALKK